MGSAGGAAARRQLGEQLAALASVFSDRPTEFADAVLDVLVGNGLVDGAHRGPGLLSPHGLLLCELARTPDATLRQLGARLGWSEGWVQKVVVQLAKAGLVSRTRSGQRVTYRIARTEAVSHPDSRRIAVLFSALAAGDTGTTPDSTP